MGREVRAWKCHLQSAEMSSQLEGIITHTGRKGGRSWHMPWPRGARRQWSTLTLGSKELHSLRKSLPDHSGWGALLQGALSCVCMQQCTFSLMQRPHSQLGGSIKKIKLHSLPSLCNLCNSIAEAEQPEVAGVGNKTALCHWSRLLYLNRASAPCVHLPTRTVAIQWLYDSVWRVAGHWALRELHRPIVDYVHRCGRGWLWAPITRQEKMSASDFTNSRYRYLFCANKRRDLSCLPWNHTGLLPHTWAQTTIYYLHFDCT